MPDTKRLVFAMLLGLVIGMAFMGLMQGSSLSTNQSIPSGHQSIANQVHLINAGVSYTAVFTGSDKTPPLSILPMSFVATGEVPCSQWQFRSDPSKSSTNYAFMTVFGPDDSGSTYWVEVSRASPIALTVSYPSGSFAFSNAGNDGLVYFEVSS